MSNLLTAIRNAVAPGANALIEEDEPALGLPAQGAPAAGPANGSALAERDRIRGIVAADAAKGLQKLAHHLAFETEMSVEAALATLAATPVEASSGRDGLSYADRRILAAHDAQPVGRSLGQPDAERHPGGGATSCLVSNMKSRHGS